MRRACIDTNVIVRFLTGEPPDMAGQARQLFAALTRTRSCCCWTTSCWPRRYGC